MLWENYLTSVGKGVSKESRNWLLSNIDVVPRPGSTRLCRWLFSSGARGRLWETWMHPHTTYSHIYKPAPAPGFPCLSQAVHTELRLGTFTSMGSGRQFGSYLQ